MKLVNNNIVELIPEILARGYYFSINEAMCRSNNGRAIIEKIPRERMLTETDAPYNERTDIQNVLHYLKMESTEVQLNFMRLLKRIKA